MVGPVRARRPLYARRQRRRLRTSLVVGVVLCLTIGGITAVVMAATGGPGGRGGLAVAHRSDGARKGGGGPVPRDLTRRQYARRQAVRREQGRAVDSILRYTPYIATGTHRRRVIALTFDDGPSPYTPAIVGSLTRLHVPATFFVVGQQLRFFSAALRDELRHGFDIGDHTENHAWLARLGAPAQRSQISTAATAVAKLGAPFPRLFRPPYGAYNYGTLSTLRRLRMLMVLWSIDPGDWRRPGTKAIIAGVLAHARPGAIVILHDGGGDRSQTVAALPSIVRGLRRRHYVLVSVPQLLALDPPPRHQQLPRLGAA